MNCGSEKKNTAGRYMNQFSKTYELRPAALSPRAFFGLPFFRPEEVEDCLVENFGTMAPDNEDIARFMDYMLEMYVSSGALFPATLWAAYAVNIIRTNNAEGFHGKLNRMFNHRRPHLFFCTRRITWATWSTGVFDRENEEYTNNTDDWYDLFVHEQMLKLEAADITWYEFVKAVSREFLPSKTL